MIPVDKIYEFPQADNLPQEFRLRRLGESDRYPNGHLHRHNYFELFYFSKGGGQHQIDFNRYPIEPGSLHMVQQGDIHQLQQDSSCNGYILLFTRSFLYSLQDFTPAAHLKLWRKKPQYALSPDEEGFVAMCIDQIDSEYSTDRPYQHTVVASLLHMIFILMFRQSPTKVQAQKHHSLTEKFLDLLEEGYTADTSAARLAEKLHCSLTTLNRNLKASGYPSAQHCIIDRQMLEARRLLFNSSWSIKEIAYSLNFTDPNYFGKLFKKYTGLTPRHFREQHR